MSRRHAVRGVVLLVLTAVTYFVWRTRESDDERAIRARIESLRDEINSSAVDGLGTVAHAARIGSYFTDDVTIELGEGASAIHGRDTLIGMAARLQPRTAAFRLEIDDVSVEMVPGGAAAADVLLTASFVRRSLSTQEESRDAREFALVCRKNAGTWRIGRVTAIDTLR